MHQFEMVARVSSPSWAHIRARGIDTKMFVVESMWDQRDLVRKEKRHFRRSHLLRLLPTTEDERGKIEKLGETCPTEMSNVYICISDYTAAVEIAVSVFVEA